MSKVRTRKLRRLGLNTKHDRRIARRYILGFVKCNRPYAYNNISCNLGYNNEFIIYYKKTKILRR